MDETTKLIVEKFAVPVLSGALGFGGAALRFYLRIQKLERLVVKHGKDLKALSELNIVELETLDTIIEALKMGMRLEIQNHRHELEELIADVRSNMHSIEDSSHDFAKEAALAQFMAQQNDRWEKVQRTLGQIEGYLRMAERR